MSALEQSLRRSGYRFIAGCDEAGRGSLAGPVVAAAVVLSYDKLPELLMDSKRLTRRRRELVAAEIKEQAVADATFRIEPREIERIDILQASLKAMARAVDKLGVPVDAVLIDGNFPPRIDGGDARRVPRRRRRKIACIAAASILAKVERDFVMEQYARQYPEVPLRAAQGLSHCGAPGSAETLRALPAAPRHLQARPGNAAAAACSTTDGIR